MIFAYWSPVSTQTAVPVQSKQEMQSKTVESMRLGVR